MVTKAAQSLAITVLSISITPDGYYVKGERGNIGAEWNLIQVKTLGAKVRSGGWGEPSGNLRIAIFMEPSPKRFLYIMVL